MSGLIGGSGSTGSSLLRRILNRHSKIYCGPESSLFCKAALYTDFKSNKRKILKKGIGGLRSNSWHVYRGVDLGLSEFGITQNEIEQCLHSSQSLDQFAELFFGQVLQNNNKSIWLEKTPGNAYNFRAFDALFEGAKIIHIYRNPYDTIASLFKRGFSPFQAVSLYLLNTSFALSAEKLDAYFEIAYEQLVSNAKKSILPLLSKFGLEWEETMLHGTSKVFEDDVSKLKHWGYDETMPIGQASVGRFHSLEEEHQNIILEACQLIWINEDLVQKSALSYDSIAALCKRLNYGEKEPQEYKYYSTLKSQKRMDLMFRVRKAAYFNYFNYPVVLKKQL